MIVQKSVQGVLLDQFGVLHDGVKAYPAAIKAVEQLASDGVMIYILSNSSRMAHVALEKICSMGFAMSWFAGAFYVEWPWLMQGLQVE
jgi:ribonucleotide monophosphatase NagD (HAD superfamily)